MPESVREYFTRAWHDSSDFTGFMPGINLIGIIPSPGFPISHLHTASFSIWKYDQSYSSSKHSHYLLNY